MALGLEPDRDFDDALTVFRLGHQTRYYYSWYLERFLADPPAAILPERTILSVLREILGEANFFDNPVVRFEDGCYS